MVTDLSAEGVRRDKPFGTDEFGEVLYWPDESFLTVAIPAPLEQFLETYADFLGETPERAAIYLLRNAIMDRAKFFADFKPSRARYLQPKGGDDA